VLPPWLALICSLPDFSALGFKCLDSFARRLGSGFLLIVAIFSFSRWSILEGDFEDGGTLEGERGMIYSNS
jgi:hypothetical protein